MVLDFSSNAAYLWALLPEIVLSLWAMGVLLIDVFQKGSREQASRPIVAWLSVSGLVLTGVANGWLLTLSETGAPGMIAIDGFRVFANFIFLLAGLLAMLVSMGYLDRHGINRSEFYVLIMYAVVGMMLFGGSRDLILMFVSLELMSVSIYVLVGFDRKDPRSSEAALKYFLLGAFASAIFLYGIALTFGATGTVNLTEIAALVGPGAPLGSPLLTAGIALLAIGFLFKVAAVPFHAWAPDAYDGAPTPVTALMATGVKAAAFAAFLRVFAVTFGGIAEYWVAIVAALAVLTMVVANLIALTQGSVKRMLAYSSIAHAGYLLVAVVAANALGAASFLFYLTVYTLMTAGAFGIVIGNARGTHERQSLDDFAGYGWQQPMLGAAFSIFLLSLAGFPLTGGFIGKLFILQSAIQAGQQWLAVVLVLASLISYFYYLRVIIVMYMRPAPSEDAHRGLHLSAPARAAIGFAAVAVLLMFFWPTLVLQAAQQSVAALFVSTDAFFGLRP